MPPAADPAFQQAMDKLLLQVNTDNVLAVHRVFQNHADDLRAELYRIRVDTQVGLCGGDPVSRDAATAFTGKIGQLLDVHWRHWQELDAAAAVLRETALSYGKTDVEISQSLSASAPP